MSVSNKKKKGIIEWGVILLIFAVIYGTGLHVEIGGFLQSMLLKTGFMEANTTQKPTNSSQIDYDFTIKDLKGQDVSFEMFRGKVVFVNFWATWCPPCLGEMPDIHGLYLKLKDNTDIEFAMINVENSHKKLEKFMQKKTYTFPVYQISEALPHQLNSTRLPTTYVIAPNGKIVFKHTGIASYNTEKFITFLKRLATTN